MGMIYLTTHYREALDGSDCGLWGVLSWNLSAETHRNHENLRLVGFPREIATEQFPYKNHRRYRYEPDWSVQYPCYFNRYADQGPYP